jgi:hypothetical protein
MQCIPNIVQPGGTILAPPAYTFGFFGLSTSSFTVGTSPAAVSGSYVVTGPSITVTFSTVASFHFVFPGDYPGYAGFGVAIPYNSTASISTDGRAVGGALTFGMAGFTNSGAGAQNAYVSTLVIAVGGGSLGMGGFGDPNTVGTTMNSGSPSTQIHDVWTLTALYIGGTMNVSLTMIGGGFDSSTLVYKSTIAFNGPFNSWSGKLSTIPAGTFASTAPGGIAPGLVVS